jgi:type II restriction/modification system DNA methylase subunit YeeA
LYVALRLLLDLQNEVINFSDELGAGRFFITVSPEQVIGIETNHYAHELAQTTIWIGYIQWLADNGYGIPKEPILKPMKNILQMDAILAFAEDDKVVEPEWPAADVIIGNPPFLGSQKMRSELGDEYSINLRKLYEERIPGASDLVCYWFEKARALIEKGDVQRVGLLATQGIRGGANRTVLERIKQTGDIFLAYADRNWVLDGAIVHVSMVGFDAGNEKEKCLDGKPVTEINPDLTSSVDLTTAKKLLENSGICFQGPVKVGPFDIENDLAMKMLDAPNPHGQPNSDVVTPVLNGSDITGENRNKWIIDFGEMEMETASLYEMPFEYVKRHVKPMRDESNDKQRRTYWWRLGRSGGDFKNAREGKDRVIFTPRVSKYRIFVWVKIEVLPDSAVVAFAFENDYEFGVLHSSIHELWARSTGTQLREAESGFRYTPSTTFETFPFPWPPGNEPVDDPCVNAIAEAAKELVEMRDRWLNAEGLDEAEKKKRTLTNLYNARPTWLDLAHKKLDEAVFAAYGWPSDLSDEEILEKLLALNLERAGGGELDE